MGETGDPLLEMMTSAMMDMMNATTTALPTKRGFYNWHNELKNETHYSNAKWLDKHKHYILLPVAFFGNLICLIVIGKKVKTSSAYVFMANMAVWDAFVIMGKAFYQFMTFNHLVIGNVGCIILAYFVDTAPLIAVALLVFLTLDRTVAIWFPLKHPRIFSVRNAVIICALIYIAMISLNCFHVWAEEGIDADPFYYCMFKKEYNDFIKKIIWVYLSLQNFIPTILLVLFNALLVYQVRRQQKLRKESMGENEKVKVGGLSREMHVTVMSIAVSVAFILLTVPVSIFIIFRHGQWEYWATRDEMHLYTVVNTIVYLLYDLNHVINVFLYFFSSEKFRADTAAIFCCCCRRKKRNANSSKSDSLATGAITMHSM